MDRDQAHSEVVTVPDTFNPYVEWLGIERVACPPDYYALLGIKRFESEKQIVATAAGAQLAKVRAVRPGGRLAEWQRVIDELGAAKNCLCDPAAKTAYDKALRERPVASGSSNAAGPKQGRTQERPTSDSKVAGQGSAGRNILPPGKSDVGKPAGVAADSAKAPAKSLNPLPPKKSSGRESETQKPGSGATKAVASPQAPTTPAMRLPLPSAIPTSAMPAATTAAIGSPGAAPLLPAGMPIQALTMPSLAIPQQAAGPGSRPAGPAAANSPTISEGSGGSAAILLADSALPTNRRAAGQPAGDGLSPLEQLGIGGAPEFRRKTGPQRRSRMPLIAVGIAVLAVIAVGFIIFSKTRLGADLLAGGGTSFSSTTTNSGTQPAATSSSSSSTATSSPIKAADPPKARPDLPGTQEKPKPAMKQAADATTQATAPKPTRPYNPLLDQAPSDVEPPKQGSTKVEPINVETPKPAPNSVKPVPEAPADPVQAAKLHQMLTDARLKLSQRQPAEAGKLIEAASKLATTRDQHEMVDRMDALEKYVDGFWSAVRDAMKALKATDEIDINSSTKVIVADATADALTIHMNGANRTFKANQLPSGLAVALALRWFDPNKADNKVYIGAFHLVDPKTGPEYAKRDWNEAASAGVDVKNLLPLLEMEAPRCCASRCASGRQVSVAGSCGRCARQGRDETAG